MSQELSQLGPLGREGLAKRWPRGCPGMALRPLAFWGPVPGRRGGLLGLATLPTGAQWGQRGWAVLVGLARGAAVRGFGAG